MIRNKFDIDSDVITITHKDWDFVATASIRDDYVEELQSVTWSKNGRYLYNKKLGGYLHIYIMKKWYGEEKYEQMKNEGYVVDHMDGNGYNCCIDNLCFLLDNENKAKGYTVDKYSKEKTHIALAMYKDFLTKHIQIAIVFNYPAKIRESTFDKIAFVDIAYLLYDREYTEVINDARTILYDYERDCTFEPNKLHFNDYHIEGTYDSPIPKEEYNKYIEGDHGHGICFIEKKAPMLGWGVEEQRNIFYIR